MPEAWRLELKHIHQLLVIGHWSLVIAQCYSLQLTIPFYYPLSFSFSLFPYYLR